MVKNGSFVIDDKDTKIKIHRAVTIKICDFGLAFRFKPGHYKCDKMPPQFALNFASPEMFNDIRYDARKVNKIHLYFFYVFVRVCVYSSGILTSG